MGNKVKDIELKNGKAILKDGSAFSGILETANKKTGDKFRIEYKDGFMVQSMKNGKLLKKFDNLENLSRSRGTKITEFNPDGSFKNLIENVYYDNGKIKKTADLKVQKSFYEDGKLRSIEHRYLKAIKKNTIPQNLNECFYPEFQSFKVYDKEGKVLTKECFNKNGVGNYIEYLPDGSKKEFVQVNLKNKINATDDIDNAEFEAAKLKLYNPKGNVEKEYSYKENYLNILDRTNGDNLSVQNDINQPFSIKLNEVSSNGYYTRVMTKE